MRLLTFILILSINNLCSQQLKNIDTTKSSISYSGNHFLHKWSAENNNLSGLIKIDNETIVSVPKIIVVPMLRKVEDTIEGTIIRNENGFEIPPVR